MQDFGFGVSNLLEEEKKNIPGIRIEREEPPKKKTLLWSNHLMFNREFYKIALIFFVFECGLLIVGCPSNNPLFQLVTLISVVFTVLCVIATMDDYWDRRTGHGLN